MRTHFKLVKRLNSVDAKKRHVTCAQVWILKCMARKVAMQTPAITMPQFLTSNCQVVPDPSCQKGKKLSLSRGCRQQWQQSELMSRCSKFERVELEFNSKHPQDRRESKQGLSCRPGGLSFCFRPFRGSQDLKRHEIREFAQEISVNDTVTVFLLCLYKGMVGILIPNIGVLRSLLLTFGTRCAL